MADLEQLFGSDSEDDDFQPHKAAANADTDHDDEDNLPEELVEEEATVQQQLEEEELEGEAERTGTYADDNDDDFRDLPPEEATGPPITLEAPPVNPLGSRDTCVVKLSNILNIEREPFNPDTFQEAEEEEYVNESGTGRMRLRNQNVIRWRRKRNADGTSEVESNARFVRWSDGSLQLLVGDEVLDVSELDVERDNSYLFLRHVQVQFLEGMGQICKKLTFRPASLKSRFHKRLREAVEKRHVKVNRVRSVATVEDPAREKAERERREEARIRATEQLERRQNKEMRRYSASGARFEGRPRGEAGITAQYLEAMDDDGDLAGDSDDGGGGADGLGVSASERARNALRRNLDDDAEAERRLAQAKRPQASAPAPAPKRQHFGPIDSDEEEEGVAEEDAPPSESRKSRQRGLVLSDDDDD